MDMAPNGKNITDIRAILEHADAVRHEAERTRARVSEYFRSRPHYPERRSRPRVDEEDGAGGPLEAA
jgi:hypothetical protein